MYANLWVLSACLVTSVCGLQVTPNSGCARLCMDDTTTDVSDPNVSNTSGSEIVCRDADYTSTSVGRKYKQCMECLQNSTASSGTENDQAWFMYNLRYAFNTCIFVADNASTPISTPCSTSNACGPLLTALETGMKDTTTMGGQYGYCSADGNAFNGSYFVNCHSCLKQTDDVYYLSNFLIALDAGCLQEPAVGTVVGLNDTLFSHNQVAIVAPASTQVSKKSHKLTTGAIIGIAVSGAVLILVVIAVLFVCYKKRRNADRLRLLRSPLDERFGAENITAPHKGAFSSPETTTATYKEGIQMQQAPRVRNFSSSPPQKAGEWTGAPPASTPSTVFSASPPSYNLSPASGRTGTMLPTHHAYIPDYSSPSSVSPQYTNSPPAQHSPYVMPSSYPQRSPSTIINSNASSPNPSPAYAPATIRTYAPPPPSSTRPKHTPSNSASLSPDYAPTTNSLSPQFQTNYSNNAHIRHQSNTSTSNSAMNAYNHNHSRRPSNTSASLSSPNSNSNSNSPMYSGPVSPAEDEAKKAREKLFREGIGGKGLGSKTIATAVRIPSPRIVHSQRSDGSDCDSEEQWPGSY